AGPGRYRPGLGTRLLGGRVHHREEELDGEFQIVSTIYRQRPSEKLFIPMSVETATNNSTPAAGAGLHAEIPQAGYRGMLRALLSFDGGRVDMLANLQHLNEQYGAVVMQRVPGFRMVNLFGPDANRFVLLDRDRTGSPCEIGRAHV